MKRVAVLRQGNTDAQRALLQRLRDKLRSQLLQQAECYRQKIIPGLAKHGIALRRWDELTPGQQEEASVHFESNFLRPSPLWSSIPSIRSHSSQICLRL